MNLIKSYIIYNVSGTVSGSTVHVDGTTVQGDGSSGSPLGVIAGVFDPAGSAAAAQAAAIAAAATDATTKANAALTSANSYTDTGLAGKQNNLGFTPENAANKDASGGYVGLDVWKIKFRNAANTFTSFLVNAASAARTYTFQNRDGTIADDTDLALKQNLIIAETTLVDASTIDIAQQNNVLATSRTTITFTISATQTFLYLTITLTGTNLVLTFPSNSLCIDTDGGESGDNTCTLSGVSGDVYEIAIKKRVSTFSVVSKKFGQ